MEYLTGNMTFAMLGCRIRRLAGYLTGNMTFAMFGCGMRWLAEYLTGDMAFRVSHWQHDVRDARVQSAAARSNVRIIHPAISLHHSDVPYARIRHYKHELKAKLMR